MLIHVGKRDPSDVFSCDLAKSQSGEICVYHCPIALKFDRRLDNTAV